MHVDIYARNMRNYHSLYHEPITPKSFLMTLCNSPRIPNSDSASVN